MSGGLASCNFTNYLSQAMQPAKIYAVLQLTLFGLADRFEQTVLMIHVRRRKQNVLARIMRARSYLQAT